VKAVDGNVVELDSTPPQTSLKLAKIAEDDEVNEVSNSVVNGLGFGALDELFDYLLDPWSQLVHRGRPDPGSFGSYAAHIAKDAFGSSSWTAFPFGYFFFDNALKNRNGKGYLSKMEQAASAESGDLYSPLGRLRGKLE